jgi:phage terminase large subunit-like protein
LESWNTACPDWADRIRAGRTLIPDLPLIKEEARKAVAIFNALRLPDVPGQPLLADAAGEWQRDLVRAIFGSFDPETSTRHIREFFCMVPKKSSKTTAGAAIMLTAVLRNRRPRAEFLLIAPTLEIADLAFRQAVGMIETDPVLSAKFHVQEHLKRITFRPTKAFLKVKSFDPKVVTGSKPSGVLLDELHVISEAPDADRVIGQLRGGLLPNPEAFLITITTQSERPPAGVFAAALRTARKVRDGELFLPLLPVLYEFPPGIDWRDPANWAMVTPNNGRSITVDRLRPDYEAAVAAGEEELRRWASQHLNVEIGLALMSDRWAGADYWESRGDESLTLDALLDRSEVVTIGIDGGGLDDLLGLSVIGRDRATREWLHWAHAWAHMVVLERRKSEAARLRDFERDGDLTIVRTLGDDIAGVVEIVQRVNETGLLASVGLDPVGIGAIVDGLAEIGIGSDRIVGIPQGWKLAGAIKTVERKLADGTFKHGGRPLMAWSVGNAKVEPKGNAIMITKQAAGTAKIDPLMATFDAAALMATNPEARGKSFWETMAAE